MADIMLIFYFSTLDISFSISVTHYGYVRLIIVDALENNATIAFKLYDLDIKTNKCIVEIFHCTPPPIYTGHESIKDVVRPKGLKLILAILNNHALLIQPNRYFAYLQKVIIIF